MRTNIKRALCGLLWGFPFLAIAAASTTQLEIAYDRDTREVAAEKVSVSCPIRILPAEDACQNKETFGQSMKGALLSGDMSKWVTDGLSDLKVFGIDVSLIKEPTPPLDESLLVKTSLTRAYTWQVGLKLFSMVALKAQFINKNGELQEKYYRAHGDKTNMWGADSEYVTTLNYGINNLLPSLARDLTSLCIGERVEQYSYTGPEQAPKNNGKNQ